MATEYIKRKDVIEAICNLCRIENDDCSYPRCTIINEVKNIPAADVVERKRGRWVGNSRHQSCSACQMTYCIPDGESGTMDMTGYHFCPNCGAQMGDE